MRTRLIVLPIVCAGLLLLALAGVVGRNPTPVGAAPVQNQRVVPPGAALPKGASAALDRGRPPADTGPAPLVTPTPTGEPCNIVSTGAATSCGPPNTYSYNFGVQTTCMTTLHSNGNIYFDTGPTTNGPWTQVDSRYFQQDFPPGISSVTGSFTEPSMNGWYRLREDIIFNNNVHFQDQTMPAPLCPGPSATPGTPSVTPGTPSVTPGTPSVTPTPAPATATPTTCMVAVTGGYSTCSGANGYGYNFSFYNSCRTPLNVDTSLLFEVSPSYSGPWTAYDQVTGLAQFLPGSNSISGTRTETNIPAQYIVFRYTLTAYLSNGQQLVRQTAPHSLCNISVTPTRTGVSQCSLSSIGTLTSCQAPGTYNYDFGLYWACEGYYSANATLTFQVAPAANGPWTDYDATTFSLSCAPGGFSVQGSRQETGIPGQYSWYRFLLHIVYPGGPSGQRILDVFSDPAPLCTLPTATVTPTATYTVLALTGTVVPPTPPPPTYTVLSLSPTVTPPFLTLSPTPFPTGTVLGSTPSPSSTPIPPTLTPCGLSFSDVPSENPFYGYVRCLACRGILSGYADGTFRPGTTITRGQLSKLTVNAARFTGVIPSDQQTFEDVPASDPFWVYIENLAGRGYISGYACGGGGEPCAPPLGRPYFRPTANVTRGQIAKIAANAAGYADPVPSTQQTFEDVLLSHPFWPYVERVAEHGVISGYGCGGGQPCVPPDNRPYFRPGSTATRGQAAKIVANTFYPGCQTPVRR